MHGLPPDPWIQHRLKQAEIVELNAMELAWRGHCGVQTLAANLPSMAPARVVAPCVADGIFGKGIEPGILEFQSVDSAGKTTARDVIGKRAAMNPRIMCMRRKAAANICANASE